MRIRSVLRMMLIVYCGYMLECIVRFPVLLISWHGWKKCESESERVKNTMMMNSLTKTSMHIHWRQALFYLNLSFLLQILLTVFRISFTRSLVSNAAVRCSMFEDRTKEKKLALYFQTRNAQLPIPNAEIQRRNISLFFSYFDFTVQFKTIESKFVYIIF